jgi:hypothetical protein
MFGQTCPGFGAWRNQGIHPRLPTEDPLTDAFSLSQTLKGVALGLLTAKVIGVWGDPMTSPACMCGEDQMLLH